MVSQRLLFCSLLAAIPQKAIAADFWSIPQTQLECIINATDNYVHQDKEPIVIVVSQCPEADVAKALAKSAVNTGTMSVAKGDKVLIMKKTEIKCLSQLDFETDDGGLVRIAKDLRCDESK